MPFCPVCRLEYRSGFTDCSDCNVALVDELPVIQPLTARHPSETDVVIARVPGRVMAEMWAELLGNKGIASRMRPVTGVVDTVYPTDTNYELIVASNDVSRAQAILPPSETAE
jgi:hypothetical protein